MPAEAQLRGPRGPAGRLGRGLLSLWLLFHLVSMGASLAKKTGPGAAVRSATAWYERSLGIWQAWGMFGPNPPLGTSWLHVAGVMRSGAEVVLPALVGERPDHRVDVHYRRVLKVERNMFSPNNTALRRSFGSWTCAQQVAAGRPVEAVRIWKARTMTPTPAQRRKGLGAGVQEIALDTVSCP